jgi:glucose-6-phosphate 1-dehydrogenase
MPFHQEPGGEGAVDRGAAWEQLKARISYLQGDFTQDVVTAAETVDVGTRGKFFDETGALRDMVPNYLFVLLAMVAMAPPSTSGAETVRDEKGKVLKAIRHRTPEEAKENGVRDAYARE